MPQDSAADTQEPQVKEEESGAPVKHIITVETKANLDSLPAVTEHTDLTWKELGCHLCGQLFKTVCVCVCVCVCVSVCVNNLKQHIQKITSFLTMIMIIMIKFDV